LTVVFFTLLIKVILAPIFFIRLIKKNALAFSVSTYLNTPLTLITIFILTSFAHSQTFLPLINIIPDNRALLSLALSSIFLSSLLIINRKGALSQILGILSLENSILAFIILAGLEQSPALQLGVIFNIFIWIIIATVFVTMMYKHFGTLNVTSMKKLKE
jgi:hydrogenase-4 component E